MVMRLHCLDFPAKRGEVPHRENIPLPSTTWTLKQGQDKQIDLGHQNKCQRLPGCVLVNFRDKRPRVHSPSDMATARFLHPRLGGHSGGAERIGKTAVF